MFNSDEADYQREMKLEDLEQRQRRLSRAIELTEAMSIDADERDDRADADFWLDVSRRLEDVWEAASNDYDSYLHWGEAA